MFDAAAGRLRIYAPAFSPNMTETAIEMGPSGAGTLFRIGSPFSGTAPSQSTEAVIGEVQIWSAALSLLQLKQIYYDSQAYWETKGITI